MASTATTTPPKKILFQTGNIMSSGYGAHLLRRKPNLENSCVELINSLKEGLLQSGANAASTSGIDLDKVEREGGDRQGGFVPVVKGDVMFVGGDSAVDGDGGGKGEEEGGLRDQREEYDITVKLFYLPNVPSASRPQHTEEAMANVLRTLGVENIDLLIVSFPDVRFDADDEDAEDNNDNEETPNSTPAPAPVSLNPPPPSTTTSTVASPDFDIPHLLPTYHSLESLLSPPRPKTSKIGLSEFGTSRLSRLLPHVTHKPSVVQINVRDCCVVPRQLIMYAKREGIELLTHNDVADILPREMVQEVVEEFRLLRAWEGEGGPAPMDSNTADVTMQDNMGEAVEGEVDGGSATGGKKRKRETTAGTSKFEVFPQWVVKYTAVVRDRGVVENKGYIAMAEIR